MTHHRILLVGAGYFAQFHAEAWKRIAGVDLCAVTDPAPSKARQFAVKWGIARAYESLDEALDKERADVVDIATRPDSHLDLTRRAARRGLHVICQKPMAPSFADCAAMCQACEEAGVRLMIHENWRWQPWYRELHRMLGAGTMGLPFQISFFWRTGDGRGPEPYPLQPYFRDMPRLLVYESLVHLLDTFRFLFGEIRTVYCRNRRNNSWIAGEDQSLIHVTFADGRLGVIDANRLSGPGISPVAMGRMVIESELGTWYLSPEGHLGHSSSDGTHQPLPWEPATFGYKGDSVFATQRHLIQSLAENRPSESDGREYLKTVALVEACYLSHETGRPIVICPDLSLETV